jgi:hypothetical protein
VFIEPLPKRLDFETQQKPTALRFQFVALTSLPSEGSLGTINPNLRVEKKIIFFGKNTSLSRQLRVE